MNEDVPVRPARISREEARGAKERERLFASAVKALRLLAGALKAAEFDRRKMAEQAHKHFLTVTELVRRLGPGPLNHAARTPL